MIADKFKKIREASTADHLLNKYSKEKKEIEKVLEHELTGLVDIFRIYVMDEIYISLYDISVGFNTLREINKRLRKHGLRIKAVNAEPGYEYGDSNIELVIDI